MNEKKPMPLGELEALIKGDLCSHDEAIRLEAQAKLSKSQIGDSNRLESSW